jgi:GNAT superfamily N-acetyltransferase
MAHVIRPATEEDLDQISSLYEEFQSFHVDGLPDRLRVPEAHEVDRAALAAAVRALVTGADRTLLVADDGGRLAGLAEVHLQPPAASPFVVPRTSAVLQSLVVTASDRGAGTGRALVAGAEAWAAARGATEVQVKTWEFAAGPLAFYEALGYTTFRRELVKPLLD